MTEPDLKDLWQSQAQEAAPMALEDIRKAARKFQGRIRWRNLIEYVAGLIVIPAFAWQAWSGPNPMHQLGAALVVLGAPVILWQLHVRGGARSTPDASAVSLVDFHRGELVRQREMFRSAWLWYLLPMAPGVVLMMASWLVFPRAIPGRTFEEDRMVVGFAMIVTALVFLVVFLVHRLAAYRLQKQIDDLDAATGA